MDGKRVSLLSGEVHYWRIPPAVWPAILTGAAEMGFETISSYTAWHLHEHQPGQFDFYGKVSEQTNLHRYLELVRDSGLNLIIRPGPYIFAEWDNYGIPDHLTPYHRQHPTFMAAADEYIRAVSAVIRPFLATRGGPVVALQADNMFDLGKDRYDTDLGLLGGDGPFQRFLRDRYSTVGDLNDAWESQYADFSQVVATTALPQASPRVERRLLDFIEFREWYTSECARWTIASYRRHSLDVPVYSNATRDQAMSAMQTRVDFMGVNFYPTEAYSGAGEHRRLLDDVRLLCAISPIPYVAELHAGVWHGYHYDKRIFQPSDCEFSWINTVGAGAVAWNWYMLHDRDNWYMSPLNSSGRPRHELAGVIRRCIEVEREIQPWTWSRQAKTGITYFHHHHAVSHGRTDDQTSTREVGRALYEAGMDYTFFPLAESGSGPAIVFYDGADWLDGEAYETLASYIDSGGRLVFFQSLPYLDEHRNAVNPLKLALPDGVESQGYMNTFYKDIRVSLSGVSVTQPTPRTAYVYRATPGAPIRALLVRSEPTRNDNVLDEYQRLVALGEQTEFTVGYTEQRGRGSITVVGLPPSPELATAIHQYLGVQIPATPKTKGVQTALYRAGTTHYLLALNNDDHDKLAEVSVDLGKRPDDTYTVRHVIGSGRRGETRGMSEQDLRRLTVNVAAKGGAILEIRPSSSAVADLSRQPQ